MTADIPEQEELPWVTAERLESYLGDPNRQASRMHVQEQMKLDECAEFPEAAISVLNQWRLQRFYVPPAYGGRLHRFETLFLLARSLARRDMTVAIAHTKTFLGGAPCWVSGQAAMAEACSVIILDGYPVCFALSEREHGSDLNSNECRVVRQEDGNWHLTGEKWLINNATRSAAAVVHVQAVQNAGPRGDALVFLAREDLCGSGVQRLPVERLHGVRGADIAGFQFNKLQLPHDALLCAPGEGLQITLRSLQLSRTLCCAFSLGTGDSALRIGIHGLERCGSLPVDPGWMALSRRMLTQSFQLMLMAECQALVTCRCLHLMPVHLGVMSSAAKYLVPTAVDSVLERATEVCAAAAALSGLSAEAQSFVAKLARDHRIVSFFDGNTIVNLQVVSSHLKQMARVRERPVSAGSNTASLIRRDLFDLHAALPEIDFSALRAGLLDSDLMARSLQTLARGELDDIGMEVRELAVRLLSSFDSLLDAVADLGHVAHSPDAIHFDIAAQYCRWHAAAASVLVWWVNRDSFGAAFSRGDWIRDGVEWLLSDGELDRMTVTAETVAWMESLHADGKAFSIIPFGSPFTP